MLPRLVCTKCGREVQEGETAEVTIERVEESIKYTVLCPLHTDKQPSGPWHPDDYEVEDSLENIDEDYVDPRTALKKDEDPMLATGKELDILASLHDIDRRDGESDKSLRFRISKAFFEMQT